MEKRKIRKFSHEELAAAFAAREAERRGPGYQPRKKLFSRDELSAHVQQRALVDPPGYQNRKIPSPPIDGLATSSRPPQDQSAGAPEAFGPGVTGRFCPTWNISMEDSIADQATAIEMISHFLPPKDEVAAEKASFEALTSDGYSILAKQIFIHRGLISKVKDEARRVAELSCDISRREVQKQQLTGEIEELRRRLASVEVEKGKEIEAMKLSAIEAANAAEATLTNRYLDGFDDCRRMACTSFPSMDFGCLVPRFGAPARAD